MNYLKIIAVILISIISFQINAQQNEPSAIQPGIQNQNASDSNSGIQPDQSPKINAQNENIQAVPTQSTGQAVVDPGSQQFILPAMVLIFGVIIIVFLMFLYSNNKEEFSSDYAIRIVSLTLITIGVLFIISTGNLSSSQNVTPLYAPAFGLLGTMAGYLLGKSFRNEGNATVSTETKVLPAPMLKSSMDQ